MTELPEISALNNILEEVNSAKNELTTEASFYKITTKNIEKYREELDRLNNDVENSKEKLMKLKIQNVEYKNTLNCVENSAQLAINKKYEAEKSLDQLKNINEEMEKSDVKTFEFYRQKWEEMKNIYESSPYAVKVNKMEIFVKLINIKKDMALSKLDSTKNAVLLYEKISEKRMQNLIIDFAEHVINSSKKRNILKEIKNRIEIKKIECSALLTEKQSILADIENLKENKNKYYNLPMSEPAIDLPILMFQKSLNVPMLELPLTPSLFNEMNTIEAQKITSEYSLKKMYNKPCEVNPKIEDQNVSNDIRKEAKDMETSIKTIEENQPKLEVNNKEIERQCTEKRKLEIISDIKLSERETAKYFKSIRNKSIIIDEPLNAIILPPKNTNIIKTNSPNINTIEISPEYQINSSPRDQQRKKVKFNENVVIADDLYQEKNEGLVIIDNNPNSVKKTSHQNLNISDNEPQYSKYFISKSEDVPLTQLTDNTSMIALKSESSDEAIPQDEYKIENEKLKDISEITAKDDYILNDEIVKKSSSQDADKFIAPSCSTARVNNVPIPNISNILKDNMLNFLEYIGQNDSQLSVDTTYPTNFMSSIVSPDEHYMDYQQTDQQPTNIQETQPNIGNHPEQTFNFLNDASCNDDGNKAFNFNFGNTTEVTKKNDFFGFF